VRFLVVILVMFGAASAAAAERVALLPLEAKGVLSGAGEQLDAAMRDAAADLGYDVQSAAATRRFLDDATAAGLSEECSLLTDACAVRVGLLAEVDVVVSTFVEIVDDRMVMRASGHPVSGGALRRVAGVVVLPAQDGGAKVKQLVGRLLRGQGEPTPLPVSVRVAPPEARLLIDGLAHVPGTLWLMPGEHTLRADADGYQAVERRFEVKESGEDDAVAVTLDAAPAPTWLYAGPAAAGVGALLFVGGAATAGGVEAALQTGSVRHGDRASASVLGITSLVVAGLGLAVAGIGGALVLAEAP
jgi:hypothetical protein